MTMATGTGVVTTLANLCDGSIYVDTWAWSPTGSVYAAVRGGTLTIVQRDGRVAMNVASLAGLDSLGWSPDGRWLTAASQTRRWLLRPDGSGLREIPGQESWSADARTIAVASPDGNLLVGGPDASDLHAIGAFPPFVSWSSDGSRFAFIRGGDAWTATRDGTDVRNLTSLPLGGAASVVWSADGRWVAVGASHGFWLVPSDGGAKHWFDLGLGEFALDDGPLGAGRGKDRRADVHEWTAGSRLRQPSSTWSIPTERPRSESRTPHSRPSWSPDGRYLAGVEGTTSGSRRPNARPGERGRLRPPRAARAVSVRSPRLGPVVAKRVRRVTSMSR